MEAKRTFQRFAAVTSTIVFLFSSSTLYALGYSGSQALLGAVAMVLFICVVFSALIFGLGVVVRLQDLLLEWILFPFLQRLFIRLKMLWGRYSGRQQP